MKYHSHPARPGQPIAFTLFFICAFALLGLSLCVSVSAQDTRYMLASAADGDGQVAGNNDSSEAAISADGRFIAFTGKASNLVAIPTTGQNVFVRDLQAGTTKLVSVNKDGTGGGNGASSEPRISADGRYVAFSSRATNLIPNDANWGCRLFSGTRRRSDAAWWSIRAHGSNSSKPISRCSLPGWSQARSSPRPIRPR
jgi:hypothetical protein